MSIFQLVIAGPCSSTVLVPIGNDMSDSEVGQVMLGPSMETKSQKTRPVLTQNFRVLDVLIPHLNIILMWDIVL